MRRDERFEPQTDFEAALVAAGQHRALFEHDDASTSLDTSRAELNFAAVAAELDAPAPSRLARLLRRLGMADTTVALVTATPALRFSWIASMVLVVLLALTLAGNSTGVGPERISGLLVIAPLVPLLGVALAFGPFADPTHEVGVATPVHGFRLFLLRAVTVLATSCAALLVAALLSPDGGWYRLAWLLPSLALSSLSLAASTRVDARWAAGTVAGAWMLLVLVANNNADVAAVFGPAMQAASVVVGAGAWLFLRGQRARLNVIEVTS